MANSIPFKVRPCVKWYGGKSFLARRIIELIPDSDVYVEPFAGGLKADHGYDPAIVQMHGIFYAWGAGVAKGREIPRLDMIDIHPTVMGLLGLQPGHPVDGHVAAGVMAK